MKRLEPNLLLAVSTGIPLLLLLATASTYGEPGQAIKYAGLALACSIGFVVFNGVWSRRAGVVRPPMIHPDVAGGAVWAVGFPMMVIAAAAVPMIWPGHDYGLLVIVASVLLGVTVESALKARQDS